MRYDKSDVSQLKQMWMDIFGDSAQFTDFYFARVFPTAKTFVLEEDGEIIAMLFSVPHVLSLCGETLPARYISGVATKPSHRHKGCMSALLEEAFAEAKAADVPFLYLVPVDPAIYVKAGFTIFGMQRFFLQTDGAACAPFSSRTAADADHAMLAEHMNRELAKQALLYEKRDAAYYARLQADVRTDGGELRLFFDADEKFCGHLAYTSMPEMELRERSGALAASLGQLQSELPLMPAAAEKPLMARMDASLQKKIGALAPQDIFLPELY